MRRLIFFAALLVLTLLGARFWGESLLADMVRNAFEAEPGLQATAVAPLRQTSRLGVLVTDLQVQRPAFSLALPQLQLSLSLLQPGQIRAGLPDRILAQTHGQPVDISLTAPFAGLDLSLLKGAALQRLRLTDSHIGLNGNEAIQTMDLQIGSVMDQTVPRAAPYDLDLQIRGLDLSAIFAAMALPAELPPNMPRQIDAFGQVRVWLDRPLNLGTLQEQPSLQLRALNITDLRIEPAGADGPTLSAQGRIKADKNGQASGILALYTTDSSALFDLAVSAGLISKTAAGLANGVLKKSAQTPLPETAEDLSLRDPLAQELRLLVEFRQGEVWLANLPIGPAPYLWDASPD